MKQALILMVFFITMLVGAASDKESDTPEPKKMVELREKWKAANKRQLSKIQLAYTKELDQLYRNLIKKKQLDHASIVKNEIGILRGDIEATVIHEANRQKFSNLQQLRQVFDKNLMENREVNRKKYAQALNRLILKFTNEGNTEAAFAVHTELNKIQKQIAKPFQRLPTNKTELKEWLKGTKWADKHGHPILSFEVDGALRNLKHSKGKPSFKVLTSRSFRITWSPRVVRTMTFEEDFQKFYNAKRDGWFTIIKE